MCRPWRGELSPRVYNKILLAQGIQLINYVFFHIPDPWEDLSTIYTLTFWKCPQGSISPTLRNPTLTTIHVTIRPAKDSIFSHHACRQEKCPPPGLGNK